MVILSPIIRLDYRDSFKVLDIIPIPIVTVRLQDLLSERTFTVNKTYRDIVSKGGLHSYLDFEGKILISLIMKDKMIANLDVKTYAKAINSLKPDFFTTLDGETYEGEYCNSWEELNRINSQNQTLLKLCPTSKPIGLVKGCSKKQIESHANFLNSLGIYDLIFHVGDFLRNGDLTMIRKARSYCCTIRKKAQRLFLYGMGAQEKLIEFSFADVFITYNHFVTAINGMQFKKTKKTKYQGKYQPNIMINNFSEMHNNLNRIKYQTRLC